MKRDELTGVLLAVTAAIVAVLVLAAYVGVALELAR